MSIRDKHVVVIGGTSGIGLATAQLAAAQGARVTTMSRRSTAAQTLQGTRFRHHAMDIRESGAVESAFAAVGLIDHVFVSAGSVAAGPVVNTPLDDLRAVIEERVLGAVRVVQQAVPRMSGGSIVLTSGLLAERPVVGLSLASGALAAIEALVKAWAVELAPVRVNAVAPGWIDTPLHDAWGENRAAVLAQQASRQPGKRIGQPDEVAAAVVALFANGFVNGAVLPVDGGIRGVA